MNNNTIDDITKIFNTIENTSNEYIDELSSITAVKISNYQMFINILFIFIVGIILYILYRDYIYRIASKLTRCSDVNDIIDFNINENDNTYIYHIYIVNVANINNIFKDFVMKIELNFLKEETNVLLGDLNIISPLLFSPTDNISKFGNAFSVFNLADKKKKYVDYYNDGKIYYIDKKKLATKKFKYYITTSKNEKLTDEASVKLATFVKKYGYNDNIDVDPIYNILYAIENKKNMEY